MLSYHTSLKSPTRGIWFFLVLPMMFPVFDITTTENFLDGQLLARLEKFALCGARYPVQNFDVFDIFSIKFCRSPLPTL